MNKYQKLYPTTDYFFFAEFVCSPLVYMVSLWVPQLPHGLLGEMAILK